MALPASQVGRATGKGRGVARVAVGCLGLLEGGRMLTAVTGGTLRSEGPGAQPSLSSERSAQKYS